MLQATVVNSHAHVVVASCPSTGEKYLKAFEYLKSKFGKDKILLIKVSPKQNTGSSNCRNVNTIWQDRNAVTGSGVTFRFVWRCQIFVKLSMVL